MLDFTPLINKTTTPLEFSRQLTIDDLRQITNESIDTLLDMVNSLDDADIVYEPHDPNADDPHAVAGEEHIGWHIGHIIAHVTSSSEEWAAYSSILARGVPYPAKPRLRYENPWREMDSYDKVVQRLEESRRMRLAFLDTWPDAPHLEIYRELSPRFVAVFGEMNAPAAFIFGLMHEVEHYDQIREARRQALAARTRI